MSSEIAWRRRWKHTLSTVTWQPLLKTKGKYFIKCLFTQNHYEVLISDLRQSYYERLSEDNFQKRSKKLNPSVEAPIGRLLEHIKERLTADKNDKETSITTKVVDEEKLILTLDTKLAGLPFTWKFQAHSSSQEMVADQLTTPLMSMVGELMRRQRELVKIIQSKDKELEDYKNQGVKVTRKHLQTSEFDETAFVNNMETSQGFEQQVMEKGANAFDTEGQNLYQCIMMRAAYLDRSEEFDSDEAEDESLQARNSTTSPKKSREVTTQGHSWANRVPGSLATPGSSSTSPSKSPTKSPAKVSEIPVKDAELLRRQALEKRLLEEEEKQDEKQKKKKKKLKL